MSRGFQPEITIKEAIDNIDANKFLLPAIQRKFVWSTEQIELLFDSIMREYPINSLMLWEITSEEIKKNYRFYSFLRKYIQRHGEMNEVLNTNGGSDFYAVIDGQQRLNSLYMNQFHNYLGLQTIDTPALSKDTKKEPPHMVQLGCLRRTSTHRRDSLCLLYNNRLYLTLII